MYVQTNKYLSRHAYKICDIDANNESSMVQNVRLLREVPPYCPDPTVVDGKPTRQNWDGTALLKGTQVGSMVKATPSTTTWKRKVT